MSDDHIQDPPPRTFHGGKAKEHWRLERTISLPLIIMLGAQAVAFIVWGANLTNNGKQLRVDLGEAEQRVAKIEQATSGLPLMQYQINQQAEAFARIEGKVDLALEKVRN